MNFEYFVARRISFQSQRSFSRIITRIAMAAIILSLAIMLVADAITIGFQSEIKDKITGFAAHILVSKSSTNSGYEMAPVNYNPDTAKLLSKLPNVSHVQTSGIKAGIIKTKEDIQGVVLKGVDKTYDWKYFKDKLVEGKVLSINDTVPSEEVLISRNISKSMRLKLGDTFYMYFVQKPIALRRFNVKGIYNTSIEEIDNLFLIADMKQVRKLNHWNENQVGGYEVFLKDTSNMWETKRNIDVMFPLDVEARTIRQRYGQIFSWLNILNVNIRIILGLMAIVAAINMITALLIMILERTQMIGTFKALGASNWAIQKIFIYNSMRLIGMGMLLGNIFALGLMYIQSTTHFIRLEESQYYLDSVPIAFDPLHILLINLGTFVFCSLSMILPSLLARAISPARALRFE